MIAKNRLLLVLSSLLILSSCNSGGNPGQSSSNGGGTSGDSQSSTNPDSSSSSSEELTADGPISAKNVYNKLAIMGQKLVYSYTSISSSGKVEYTDVYNNDYVLCNPDKMAYVLIDNPFGEGKMVYTLPTDQKDSNGNTKLELGTAYAKKNALTGAVEGYYSTLYHWNYMALFDTYRGEDALFDVSAIRKKRGVDGVYLTTNEYILKILGFLSGYSKYISAQFEQADFFYDSEDNLCFYLYIKEDSSSDDDWSNPDAYKTGETTENTSTLPFLPSKLESSLEYAGGGIFKDVGTARSREIDNFLASDAEVKTKQTTKPNEGADALFLKENYSALTSYHFDFYDEKKADVDFGKVYFDYNDSAFRRDQVSASGATISEQIRKDEYGYAYQEYLGSSNQVEKKLTDNPFANYYSPKTGFDLDGFRKVEGKDYYLYYGLNHYKLFKSLTMAPMDDSEFGIQRIEAKLNSDSNFVTLKFISTLGYYKVDSFTSYFGRLIYETTIATSPREIASPAPLASDEETNSFKGAFDRLSDHTKAIKTVAKEQYKSSTSDAETVTTYYTDSIVYHERSRTEMNGNATRYGYGYYLSEDGVVYFSSNKDSKTNQMVYKVKSAPSKEVSIFDYWVPNNAKAEAFTLDKNATTPTLKIRQGILYPQYSLPYCGKNIWMGSDIGPDQMGDISLTLSNDKKEIKSLNYNFTYTNSFFGIYDAGNGYVNFFYEETSPSEVALPEGLLEGVKEAAKTKYMEPTKWSECKSNNLSYMQKVFGNYFEGTDLTIDDIPYLYDPFLETNWNVYNDPTPSAPAKARVWLWASGFSGDGDVNNFLIRYKALLAKTEGYEHYIFEDAVGRRYDAYKNGKLDIVVNKDLTQGLYITKIA